MLWVSHPLLQPREGGGEWGPHLSRAPELGGTARRRARRRGLHPQGGRGALCPPPSEPTPRPRCPQINLNKGDEYWWNAILEGEEQIDIDKINKERSMATVDEEEHAVLDRLTFDYHQKLQGKPQSHELVGAPRSTAPGAGCWAPRLPPCLGCGRRRGPAAPRPPWARLPAAFAIFWAKKIGVWGQPQADGRRRLFAEGA